MSKGRHAARERLLHVGVDANEKLPNLRRQSNTWIWRRPEGSTHRVVQCRPLCRGSDNCPHLHDKVLQRQMLTDEWLQSTKRERSSLRERTASAREPIRLSHRGSAEGKTLQKWMHLRPRAQEHSIRCGKMSALNKSIHSNYKIPALASPGPQ